MMVKQGDDILFIYGDVDNRDDDAALFSALKDSFSVNLYEVMERVASHPCKATRFVLRDSPVKKRKLRRDSFHR